MNFTIYQVLAFIGALAGIAIVCGIGFIEGRRSLRADYDAAADDHRQLHDLMRTKLRHARAERDISRHNAAQAIEALTEERDRHAEQATTLQLRLTSTQERVAALQARSLNDEAAEDLAAMAAKLSLAATQFNLMGATDQASSALALAAKARDLSQRYYDALPVQAQQQERAA